MIDLIERARQILPSLPRVKYVFFNTGLEMQATKNHVKETATKYGVEIEELRSKIDIVTAVRRFGVPFISKLMSQGIEDWQIKDIPLSIVDEYNNANDKKEKAKELLERFPNCRRTICFLCCFDKDGRELNNSQSIISSSKYMYEFISEFPPDFQISAKCCDYCKKQVAHEAQKDYDMIITGERIDEGGVRANAMHDKTCFQELSNGQYRLKPLYYVTNKDKIWYKKTYNIKYSDAYEVYGLLRTGCCGCPISYRAIEDLEKIGKYEPNIVKAAWNVFGKSYEYRKKYNEYKHKRMALLKQNRNNLEGQLSFFC